MPRFPTPPRFQRSGYWLRLGRRRVWLEPSPLTDRLAARDEAEQQRDHARHFRDQPHSWP